MKIFLSIMLVVFFAQMFTEKDHNKAQLFTYALIADIVALTVLAIILR